MFFVPTPDGFGSLFPLAALLAGVTILVLLGGWASRESIQHRHGVAMRVPPVVFWITAVPMTVAIVFLALVLLLPLMFAIVASGFWFGAVAL